MVSAGVDESLQSFGNEERFLDCALFVSQGGFETQGKREDSKFKRAGRMPFVPQDEPALQGSAREEKRRAPFRRQPAAFFDGFLWLLFVEIHIRSERNAAQNFQVACGSKGCKALAGWWSGTCGIQAVGNLDELVWIRALIAIAAYCGGDRVDGCGAVVVHNARDIAKTIGGGRTAPLPTRATNRARPSGRASKYATLCFSGRVISRLPF